MDALLLLLGLAALVLSGELLVRYASSIAVKASIPPVIIGLTIVSLGTSAPEVMASVRAALNGNPGIAIGNVIGSNIANLALILGITALIHPVAVNRSLIRSDWPVMFAASILFVLFAYDGQLEQWEGGLLFACTFVLIAMLYWRSKKDRRPNEEELDLGVEPVLHRPVIWLMSGIGLACAGLYYGSEWFIQGASGLAVSAGVSDHVIGLTAVAFGTSIPELVTSGVAAMKRESDLALGSLIGSNIFNIFLAIGVSAGITAMPVDGQAIASDFWWMLLVAAMILPMMMHQRLIHRWKGIILVATYAVYITVVILGT